MSERKSRVWFSIMFSLLIRQCWNILINRNYAEVAKSLAAEFSTKFDESDGAWVAVVGKRPLGCWIWKDEHDYACLDVNDYRLIIYRRNLNRDHSAANQNNKLHQSHLDAILKEAIHLKEKDDWHDLNVAKFVREKLQSTFEGFYWHTAAGHKNQFAVHCSQNGENFDLKLWASEFGNWRTLVWEG
jgi:hypothetical protein